MDLNGTPLKEKPQRICWGDPKDVQGRSEGGTETPKPSQWAQEEPPLKEGPQRIYGGVREGMREELRPQSHPNGPKRSLPLRRDPKGSMGGVREEMGEELRPQSHPNGPKWDPPLRRDPKGSTGGTPEDLWGGSEESKFRPQSHPVAPKATKAPPGAPLTDPWIGRAPAGSPSPSQPG